MYSVDSQETTMNYYPSKNSPDDVVYLESVPQAHDVIGVVTVTTERNQKMEVIIQKMKREAAILGADAITNINTDATGTWKKLPPNLLGNAYVRANFSATAVVFKK